MRDAVRKLWPEIDWIQDKDLNASRNLFLDEHGLSYADAVGIRTALDKGQELLTFDGHQRRALDRLRAA